MSSRRGLKPLDYLAVLLFLVLTILSVFWAGDAREGELRVEIEASGEVYVMPLSSDGELTVEGPVGETHIHVRDGKAFVAASDCRDEVCVAMGEISRPSAWIACLPNRVFVRIVAIGETDGEEIDAGAF